MPPVTIDPKVDLADVKRRLLKARITGLHTSHTRQNAISKLHALVEGDPDGAFGLSGMEDLDPRDVLGYLSELTGCSNDLDDLAGWDTIDPDKTVAGIVAAAERLKEAAAQGRTLLTCTGHPTGMLEHNIRVVDAYRRAGGKPVVLREEEEFPVGHKGKVAQVRYAGAVGCLADWGALKHTHMPTAMEVLLEEQPWPDIVFADHGFAGAAIERGIPTIAVMDINDPALAAAWGLGRDVTIIPMDDNRPQRLYSPSWEVFEAYLSGE